MIIKTTEFITSAIEPSRYPDLGLPEIAFAGRSNVGKSSLINCLVNRKNLVKTSATPGKTRLINFFSLNDRLMLVDLPGYGYARVSRQEQKKWGPMVETYLAGRDLLKGVMLLVDLRRLPQEDDFKLREWLNYYHIPCHIILTKADKLKKTASLKQVRTIAEAFGMNADKLVLFSIRSRLGRETVLSLMDDLVGINPDEEGTADDQRMTEAVSKDTKGQYDK